MEPFWTITIRTTSPFTSHHVYQWRFAGRTVAAFFTGQEQAEQFAAAESHWFATEPLTMSRLTMEDLTAAVVDLIYDRVAYFAVNPLGREQMRCLPPDAFLAVLFEHCYEAGVDAASD